MKVKLRRSISMIATSKTTRTRRWKTVMKTRNPHLMVPNPRLRSGKLEFVEDEWKISNVLIRSSHTLRAGAWISFFSSFLQRS